MSDFIDTFWQMRLEKCKTALEKNNFEAFVAQTSSEAKKIFVERILPNLQVKTASWGDSMTMYATDVFDVIRQNSEIEIIETFATDVPREEIIERRRQALLVDLFFTGSNAVTETGKLVNLDMVGNRVGAITFGPRNVIIFVGRNKIVTDVETAMQRIKSYAAPLNAIRHTGWKTPCMKTSYCMDCNSPDRICNTWTITEKSFPKKRIIVVLINEDLGL
jgi:L-lactate utilization protein LutB